MKVATWNVNSIRMRIEHLTDWLNKNNPDVIMLQEIKTVAETFPFEAIEALGYKCQVLGQKSYNGVATLSKKESTIIKNNILDGDPQARYLEVEIEGIKYINIYIPNGNPIETKLDYKHSWLESLTNHMEELLANKEKFIIGGDFNIIPEQLDAYNFDAFKKDAIGIQSVRDFFNKWQQMGLIDVLRNEHPNKPELYTWWDYRTGGINNNRGLRIDHFLIPNYMESIDSSIDISVRMLEKPSDHTIVITNIKV